MHLASALLIRIGNSLLIPGTAKALPVGAREKAKSGDEAGEIIIFQNSFQQPMMSFCRYLGKYVSLVLGEEDAVVVVVAEEVVVEVVEEVMDMIAMVVVSNISLFICSLQIYLQIHPLVRRRRSSGRIRRPQEGHRGGEQGAGCQEEEGAGGDRATGAGTEGSSDHTAMAILESGVGCSSIRLSLAAVEWASSG